MKPPGAFGRPILRVLPACAGGQGRGWFSPASFFIIKGEDMMAKKIKPVHPGEILREEFMTPLKLSMNKIAMALRVPVTRIATS